MAADRSALHGRCALVTGGSVGIGRAVALALAAAGADVAIQFSPDADRTIERPGAAEETRVAIGANGRRGISLAADFGIADEARRCGAEAVRLLGGIDMLVLCASVQKRGSFADVTTAEIARQVAINFSANVELLQSLLPAMAARGWGRVLSIGSVNQLRPDPELAVYAALKAAQHNLILGLARYYAPSGVTLNTLSPGLIATDRNRSRREDAEAWRSIQSAANPMARAGTPEDVVGAALLLCSPASGFITGVDLPVAGGGQL